MKKIILILFILISTLNSQTLKSLTDAEKDFIKNHPIINVGVEKDWPPFDYIENDEYKGLAKDYLTLIEKKTGLKFDYKTDSWANLLKKSKNKQIDLLPILAKTKERSKYLLYTNQYIEVRDYIFTKDTYKYIEKIEDLYGKTIAIPKGFVQESFLKDNHPKIKILTVNSLIDAIDAVITNKADATISNTAIITFLIKKHNISGIKAQKSFQFDGSKLYMATRKDYPLLRNIIQKALNDISFDEKNKIYNKWTVLAKNKSKEKVLLTEEEKNFILNNNINIAYTDNWAPLSFHENKKAKGMGFDFWNYIVKENNIKFTTELQKSFKDALNSIKTKTSDIIITTSKTKDREEYSIFSNTYFKAPIGIATLHNSDYIPNIEAIKDKKIGVGKNFSAHRLLKEKYPDLNFVFIKNSVDGLNKLSSNEIFALVDVMPVLAHNISKFGYSNIKISGSTGVNLNLQIMIRDDYQILQSIINKTLKNLEISERNKIYNKWSRVNYQTPVDYSVLWKILVPLIIIILIIVYKNRELLIYQKNLKKTKEELENSLLTFKTLVDLTIEGIVIIQKNKIVFSNSEMLKIFEKKKKEMLNKDIKIFFDFEKEFDITQIIEDSDLNTLEIQGLRNNEKFPCLIKAKNIIFKNQKSIILSLIDMSEIKENERLLINQSKMASLGEMIGNIAHQWRQPLSFISSSASGLVLQKEYGIVEEKEIIKSLKNINETTQFLSQTIDDFQDYLKKDKDKTTFNVEKNIQKVLNIVSESFKNYSINLLLDINKEITLHTYSNELKQVILNILNNSKDALKHSSQEKKYILVTVYEKNASTIIEIVDNGGGIDTAIINRVFEPYFTTKHKKQGTGLGLYMTHKIITESIEGKINIINCSHTFENNLFERCTKVSIHIPNSPIDIN